MIGKFNQVCQLRDLFYDNFSYDRCDLTSEIELVKDVSERLNLGYPITGIASIKNAYTDGFTLYVTEHKEPNSIFALYYPITTN